MITATSISLRAFPVTAEDQDGAKISDWVFLTKAQLQAAQIVGQSSKELIERLYKRKGYRVISIGKPKKQRIDITLDGEAWGGTISWVKA